MAFMSPSEVTFMNGRLKADVSRFVMVVVDIYATPFVSHRLTTGVNTYASEWNSGQKN